MLPLNQRILFLVFASIAGALGLRGFYRLFRRIAAGKADTDQRTDHIPRRIWYALTTTLLQSRTFRKRPVVSTLHSFIFYGFTFYLLVNVADAVDGFVPLSFHSLGLAGNLYTLAADILSALVLFGVVALVFRRFALPSRRDFTFNERTLLHPDIRRQYITRDSIVVSAFILFHVGSRAIGAAAKLSAEGPDHFAPFATLLAHAIAPEHALTWRIFGYWGALGSVLAFLAYFPYSKHIHIFMAPVKYLLARSVTSGVLPLAELNADAESPMLGANKLEDLAWPRLLDAYACVQCNRCQDACPATATGKSLSPSALEMNKRMELNDLSRRLPAFESGAPSPNALLSFALSPEAAWACTTCGACIDVCPVGDEPMLDIIDIRRQQVMIEGEFPPQLQTAFRGMERTKNPWGINHDKRLDWASGLPVRTTEDNPGADVLFWVGCAASYDPQSQKTARAFVQLLDHAGVDFAVLGKRECCTGDTARRAGNEYLYRQLADANVATLNALKPKLIVATCPHCMNTVGKEYKQLGGDYKVLHHTEYLEQLVAEGRLVPEQASSAVAFHDPCYLGRHNGVYDAPRNLLHILSDSVVELPRNRENSFCCGAGGAQFWKEEEAGSERISDNRYREAKQALAFTEDKVLAVGCPFCKSMLESTPSKNEGAVAVRDIAELLLEGIQKRSKEAPLRAEAVPPTPSAVRQAILEALPAAASSEQSVAAASPMAPLVQGEASEQIVRKKWTPKKDTAAGLSVPAEPEGPAAKAAAADVSKDAGAPLKRKAWTPKKQVAVEPKPEPSAAKQTLVAASPEPASSDTPDTPLASGEQAAPAPPAVRKVWKPKSSA